MTQGTTTQTHTLPDNEADKIIHELSRRISQLEALVAPPRDPSRGTGSSAAALLAAGIGSAVFGVAVVLAEAVEPIHDALGFHEPTGPLGGKALVAIAAWLVSWGVLNLALAHRRMRLDRAVKITFFLVGIGFFLTLPPVFQLIARL